MNSVTASIKWWSIVFPSLRFWIFLLVCIPKGQFPYFPYRLLLCEKYLVYVQTLVLRQWELCCADAIIFAYLSVCCVCAPLSISIFIEHPRAFVSPHLVSISAAWMVLKRSSATPTPSTLMRWGWNRASGASNRSPPTLITRPSGSWTCVGGMRWKEKGKKRKYDTAEEVGFNVWLNGES